MEYFEDLHNGDKEEKVAVNMCSLYGVRTGNYFEEETLGRIKWG